MRLIAEQDRLVKILRESIALMCKSTLSYDVDLCVEGLLGITLDKKDVVLVNIKEEITVKQIPEPSPPSEVDEAKNVTYVASRQSRLMPYKKKPKRFKERPRKLQQTTTVSDEQSSESRGDDYTETVQPEDLCTHASCNVPDREDASHARYQQQSLSNASMPQDDHQNEPSPINIITIDGEVTESTVDSQVNQTPEYHHERGDASPPSSPRDLQRWAAQEHNKGVEAPTPSPPLDIQRWAGRKLPPSPALDMRSNIQKQVHGSDRLQLEQCRSELQVHPIKISHCVGSYQVYMTEGEKGAEPREDAIISCDSPDVKTEVVDVDLDAVLQQYVVQNRHSAGDDQHVEPSEPQNQQQTPHFKRVLTDNIQDNNIPVKPSPVKPQLSGLPRRRSSSRGPMRCPRAGCGMTFPTWLRLKQHLYIHEFPGRRHRCLECGTSYSRRFGLMQHQRRKHGLEGGLRCPICGDVFGQKSHFDDHMDIHLSGKAYNCSCGKAFQRRQGLKRHQKTCPETIALPMMLSQTI